MQLRRIKFDAIILNFANPDMVGHSGMLEPTIKAIETVDDCLGRIIDAIQAKGGHGNCYCGSRQCG